MELAEEIHKEIKPRGNLEKLRCELYSIMSLLSKMISDLRFEKYQQKENLDDLDKKIKSVEKAVAKAHKQIEESEKKIKKGKYG